MKLNLGNSLESKKKKGFTFFFVIFFLIRTMNEPSAFAKPVINQGFKIFLVKSLALVE